MTEQLTFRQYATIEILIFIIRILNPTGHEYQVNELRKRILSGGTND